MKNYYKILKIGNNATKDEISKAYKVLARKYHPDINQESDATEKFREIVEAYNILKNEKTRSEYDEKLKIFASDLYKKNDNNSQNSKNKNQDYKIHQFFKHKNTYLVRNNLKTNIKFLIKKYKKFLSECNPFIFFPNKKIEFGNFFEKLNFIEILIEPREAIWGAKKLISISNGEVKKDIFITIPKGSYNGSILKLKDKESKEEIIILIRIKKHNVISIEEKGIIANFPISFKEAMLGAKVKIKTLDGKCYVNIPKGINSGNELRIANKGIMNITGKRGDFFLKILISSSQNKNEIKDENLKIIDELDCAFDYKKRDEIFEKHISEIF